MVLLKSFSFYGRGDVAGYNAVRDVEQTLEGL